ncbi:MULTISPECIES: aminodeoxychorismate synthase, component I [Haloferax]|uniref:anthranilate synthase n=1 Tax=Haloferax massiliensis TaxID=1476858 RepID=A0A0D6JSE3_9EURY|nr:MULTISPECIES: aminodeoxychorismate synthase, component I [Haloferax]MDS0240685.1 aminodeoxychorismate synthase, component I [Haloferax sp. S2CR25]MDS0443806.1 aminodeoxychorismate synthase, component I [Haloferax sp. S2CR25-2]CQR50807.1 Aminodeoxychorismate synthase component 1 [Haloferax massiliensis]
MTAPTVVTDRDDFRATAAVASAGSRVPVEARVAVSDPFDAYRRARRDAGGFFYETTGGQPGWGAFGVDPAERLTVDDPTDGPTAGDWDDSGDDTAPSLAALESLADAETLVRGDCDVPYPCGLFGWLSYDAARELESLPEQTTDDRELPHLQLGLYDLVASWEEPRPDDGETTLRVTCCPVVEDGADLDAVYDEARGRATDLAVEAVEGDPDPVAAPVEADEATFASAPGREAFADRVRAAKRYIRDGDTFQANLSQRLVAPAAVHPVDAYAALREVNPAPYSGLLELPGVDLVSASPELLLRVEGDRLVTEPIAGTRPRGATPEEDDALEADLTTDEKERAEHAMLVDLERNDLGKVSEYGSVEVTEYRRVDRYSEVMHLVSLVEGTRREGTSLADAVAAVFPGGTITGAPKPRTMEIIDELEATRRGPYTGSMFAVGFDDRAVLNIVIRTLVRFGDEYHLRVGAGIVHDSDPEDEYDETLAKARALVTAIDEALGERASMAVGAER